MTIDELAKQLTPQERRFAQEYLRDYNATEAAIRAGFQGTRPAAANKGSKLLRREPVREYIDALLDEQARSAGVSKSGIVARLLDITQRCMEAEPVMEWDSAAKEWKESGTYKFDARGAAKALEQLSRMLGYDQDAEAPAPVEVTIRGFAADDGG